MIGYFVQVPEDVALANRLMGQSLFQDAKHIAEGKMLDSSLQTVS